MTSGIEITAATVWDHQQIARWASLGNYSRRVTSVFGCRQKQLVGHGRAPGDVPEVTDLQIEQHSAVARSVGLKFLYLLNGRCERLQFDNPEVRERLVDDLNWIVNAVHASGVIVADLRLARLIRSYYPKELLEIRVSTIAAVRTLKDLQPWMTLDIEGVVLHHDAARDFQALRQLVDYLKERAPHIQLELLLNESCLHGCASRNAHYARLADASRGYVEGFQQNCNIPKFQEPSLILSADWIRPEDMGYYESLGIRRLKIAGREMSSQWLDRTVSAYVNGRYDGNLIDLLTITPPGLNAKASEILYVDNPSLSGVIEQFSSWNGSRRDFYSHLAVQLWEQGYLRMNDPGATYRVAKGRLFCTQPGQHHLSLCSLQAFADSEYRMRKANQH
jgi:collagenase-like PrtC family protease